MEVWQPALKHITATYVRTGITSPQNKHQQLYISVVNSFDWLHFFQKMQDFVTQWKINISNPLEASRFPSLIIAILKNIYLKNSGTNMFQLVFYFTICT